MSQLRRVSAEEFLRQVTGKDASFHSSSGNCVSVQTFFGKCDNVQTFSGKGDSAEIFSGNCNDVEVLPGKETGVQAFFEKSTNAQTLPGRGYSIQSRTTETPLDRNSLTFKEHDKKSENPVCSNNMHTQTVEAVASGSTNVHPLEDPGKTAEVVASLSIDDNVFYLDKKIKVSQNLSVLYLPVGDVRQLRSNWFMKNLVSVMNTGCPGYIFLGATEDGRVKGIKCAKESQMHTFIEGLRKCVVFYLQPKQKTLSSVGIQCHQVYSSVTGSCLPRVWIVVVKTTPEKNIYYNSAADLDYHVLKNGRPQTIPFEVFCQSIAFSASKKWTTDIGDLESRVMELENKLKLADIDVPEDEEDLKCYFTDCPNAYHGQSLIQ